ncbi:MAG: DegT/DnrJ/EryC1/StrS family aminotransferase [Candidatus Helarchaeota archaeon]
MKVRLFKPSLGQEELDAIKDVFERAWLGLGPKVSEFEEAWADYIGCKVALGVNSGTAALHLALAAWEFKPGKKVLVPAMTFISSAMAAIYNRLEPVFVDCNEETMGMDLEDLERKITPDCVAIVAVHMGGHPLPMEHLKEIARIYKLKIVEDCAHCAGGEYKGRKLGTWGDIGCFSFEEKKGMTTGDGGMICTDDFDLINKIRPMRWLGIDKDTWKRSSLYTDKKADSRHWYYEIHGIGYKYNMNDLSACIGLAQLKKLDDFNSKRRRAIGRYLKNLEGIDHVKPLLPYDLSSNSAYWIFGLRSRRRDDLIRHLKRKGIATGVHYMSLPLHPIFSDHKESTPTANRLSNEIITLPLFTDISDEEIDYVSKAVQEFYKN